jgi:hypothetical protein
MPRARLSVWLDERIRQRLVEEARASGKSESGIILQALAAYFPTRDREMSCLELARRNGIVGCAKGLPSDLSTNREYFNGNTV